MKTCKRNKRKSQSTFKKRRGTKFCSTFSKSRKRGNSQTTFGKSRKIQKGGLFDWARTKNKKFYENKIIKYVNEINRNIKIIEKITRNLGNKAIITEELEKIQVLLFKIYEIIYKNKIPFLDEDEIYKFEIKKIDVSRLMKILDNLRFTKDDSIIDLKRDIIELLHNLSLTEKSLDQMQEQEEQEEIKKNKKIEEKQEETNLLDDMNTIKKENPETYLSKMADQQSRQLEKANESWELLQKPIKYKSKQDYIKDSDTNIQNLLQLYKEALSLICENKTIDSLEEINLIDNNWNELINNLSGLFNKTNITIDNFKIIIDNYILLLEDETIQNYFNIFKSTCLDKNTNKKLYDTLKINYYNKLIKIKQLQKWSF
jgi:hypothetical protein